MNSAAKTTSSANSFAKATDNGNQTATTNARANATLGLTLSFKTTAAAHRGRSTTRNARSTPTRASGTNLIQNTTVDPSSDANAISSLMSGSITTMSPNAAASQPSACGDSTGTATAAMAAKLATDVANYASGKSAAPTAAKRTPLSAAHGDQGDQNGGGTDASVLAAAVSQAQATAKPSQPVAAAIVVNAPSTAVPAAAAVGNSAITAAPAVRFGNTAVATPTVPVGIPFSNTAPAAPVVDTAIKAAPAAFVVSTATKDAKAAAHGPASGTPSDKSAGVGAETTLPLMSEQVGPSTKDAKEAAPAKQTASANQADRGPNIKAGSPEDTANTQTSSDSAPQQAQAQTDSDAVTPAPTASAPTDSNHATARADALFPPSRFDAAGLSGAQTANGAPKIDGLPNFGFSAANTATPLAAAATPGSAAAAVPVVGLAVAIAARAQPGSNQFDIRLHPPELGRIDVRLDVDRNGQVTSHITADRADTLQLLQRQQPQLERALEQAGLKTADNGLQFTLRDQSFAGQNGSSGGDQQNAAQLVVSDAELAPIETTQIYSRLRLGGGIDIRV
jgi:flagellar hook-length control protein FliK